MKNLVFVDMDGLITDLNKSLCPLFGVPYPTQTILGFDWVIQQSGHSADQFFETIEQHPEFWHDVEPTIWLPRLLQILDLYAPDWRMLTCASLDPRSWSGKAQWITQHLGKQMLHRTVMVGPGDKGCLARPGSILLDDHHSHCKSWNEHGGRSFHWIEYTPDQPELIADQLVYLESFLKQNA